jgi:prepilin-type processing-associated H-X9-DG protein
MPYLGKSPSFGVRQRYQYTATASQTTFSGTDTANLTLNYTDNNFVDVYQNGVLLKGGGNDYTATSGTSVVLGTGATADDVIEIIVYDAFSAANFYSRTDSDSRYQTTLAGIDDQSSSNDDQVTITDTTVVINEDSDDVDFRVESNGNANMLFVDGGNDRVGIGTNAPVTDLHLITSTQGDVITFESTEAGANTGPNLLLYRNSSSPADDDNIGAIRFRGRNDNSQDVDYAEIESFIDDASDGTEDGGLAFRTTGGGTSAERMRIDPDGNIAIGNNNPADDTPGIGIQFDVTSTTTSFMNIGHTSGAGTGDGFIRFVRSGTVIGQVQTDGVTNVQYTTSSDYRLKENIVTEWDATSRLKQLKPSRFNFKEEKDRTRDGFIAHEVSSIVPEAVGGEKDAVDKDGKPQYQGIDHSKLVPLLTKALQESIARADALEARIKKLEDG